MKTETKRAVRPARKINMKQRSDDLVSVALRQIETLNDTLAKMRSPLEIYGYARYDKSDPLVVGMEIELKVRAAYEWT